ncbi:hypothetical protein [Actinoplanes sp. NPDC049599]|jgi:hypothetical protein|uniref:hypothetical protein n=1 Tax=Actinoplanes sp. NPDC049599 TaxID=3363903 RepID=UPI0037BAB738
MMTTLIGSEGSVLWLVLVLLVLASGLAGALLAAVRSSSAPIRTEHRAPER